MQFDDILGRTVSCLIRRFGSPGAFLAAETADDGGAEGDVILLPGAEIPEGAREGDVVRAFMYRDSEGRPIATLREPRLERDEVAFLRVTACTNFGAFVDWGPSKELLVPHAEQTLDMRVGDSHAVGLFVDASGRLAGTMKVSEMLRTTGAPFELDAWADGEAWRNSETGLFVIVEKKYVGLVPATEPHTLTRGERARFRVASRLPDGKVELSLRGHAHEELERDAEAILQKLRLPKPPALGDRSSPDAIRAAFGLSKKAFKRAAGRLLKDGTAIVDERGYLILARP